MNLNSLPHRAGDAFAGLVGRLADRQLKLGATIRSRGIVARSEIQQARFESILAAFTIGYRSAVARATSEQLAAALNSVELSLRGFAYEGAGMGLAVREALNPWRRPLLAPFTAGPAASFAELVYVGAGWIMGRVPGVRRIMDAAPPFSRWIMYNGAGFADFFMAGFPAGNTFPGCAGPEPFAGQAYDQGVGRALWFASAADPARLIPRVRGFAPERHPNLWAGLGLAMLYAGLPSEEDLATVRAAAGADDAGLAFGAAVAAAALRRGRQLAPRH